MAALSHKIRKVLVAFATFWDVVPFAWSKMAHSMPAVQAMGKRSRVWRASLLKGYHLELAKFTATFAHLATSNC